MGKAARKYTDKTLKRLFGLSGNICAFPDCEKTLVNQNNAKDSNICHIEAANYPGERYRDDMSDEERADYPNLILLCVQHHDETNDEDIYTVTVLKNMKQDHESRYLSQKINNNPSMLANTINAIAEIDFENHSSTASLAAFDPKDKISYNSLKKNASFIHEYKVYHNKINILYDELEYQGSIKKEKLLATIRSIYLSIKGQYVLDSEHPQDIIQKKSDDIFDKVYDQLVFEVQDSSFWNEDIILGIRLIMVDAFLRCKILEEPPKNDN